MSYVICEKEWEYNDEDYDCNGNGGVPKHIINDRHEAEQLLAKLNAEALDGLSIGLYGGGDLYYDLSETDKYDDDLAEIGVKLEDDRWGGPTIPKGLPLETLYKLADLFPDVEMYSMFEVD